MGTADLRDESRREGSRGFTKAMDELQAAMIVIPTAAAYAPKFTYIWSLGIDRFPDELRQARQARQSPCGKSRGAFWPAPA